MVLGYEAHGQHEEAWKLTQEALNALHEKKRIHDPDYITSWVERMVQGCEARGQYEEAWWLIKETFSALRQKGVYLYDPKIVPWIERMVQGYEAHGQHEQAWELIQEAFNAHSQTRNICHDPRIAALWVERMVPSNEALQLTQKLYNAYGGEEASLSSLGIDVFSELFDGASVTDSTLLNMIPRQKRLELLASAKISPICRLIVSRSLRYTQSECKLVILEKDGERLEIHQDVLCFWSGYFKAALSGRWRVQDVYNWDLNNMFTITSLRKVFEGSLYTGRSYKRGSNEEYEMEKRIADYFDIKGLVL
ncbi:uncharacterized protein TRIVIDRAFT_216477 [Trichoderma virens Gv29-8]|uniref:BTB domain-containing protein n=1 Tax=Hypocrea virens (strain Gv29-8 / FGSC 10586) TaxID=413071 RepID=G9N0J1_HYPVG|nr:uncharacterized protein TRIVIDRAFT_216477 [Trichoderma virens Gv29-8]EHK19873.1 hypothetical protein TRIVIDRAFT_216477 [Trichoderma virens Gv29-8]